MLMLVLDLMKDLPGMSRSLLLFSLLVLDARLGRSHRNCRIYCDDDDPPSLGGSAARGKAGPKGEKGERGECGARELDQVFQEMNATKEIFRGWSPNWPRAMKPISIKI